MGEVVSVLVLWGWEDGDETVWLDGLLEVALSINVYGCLVAFSLDGGGGGEVVEQVIHRPDARSHDKPVALFFVITDELTYCRGGGH